MPRVAVLDCDVKKNFPPSLTFQYYGECVQQWLEEPADAGNGWTYTQVLPTTAVTASYQLAFPALFLTPPNGLRSSALPTAPRTTSRWTSLRSLRVRPTSYTQRSSSVLL